VVLVFPRLIPVMNSMSQKILIQEKLFSVDEDGTNKGGKIQRAKLGKWKKRFPPLTQFPRQRFSLPKCPFSCRVFWVISFRFLLVSIKDCAIKSLLCKKAKKASSKKEKIEKKRLPFFCFFRSVFVFGMERCFFVSFCVFLGNWSWDWLLA